MQRYQARVDAIDTLRSYVSQNKKVKCKDGYLHFDNLRLKLNTQTAWLSPITNQKYDLGSLWLLVDCDINGVSFSDYIEKTSKYNVTLIAGADKPQILSYFKGEINESECINDDLKFQIVEKQIKKDRQNEELMAQKKVVIETEDELNLQVMQWLRTFSKPITSKTKALRTDKSYEDVIKALAERGTGEEVVQGQKKTKLASIFEKKKNPIIILPDQCIPGNVDVKNFRSLMMDSNYIESSNLGDTFVRKIELTHPIKEKTVVFEATNNPSLLTPDDWNCVVCIFVSGKHSQFEDWPERDPHKLFKKYRGFFVKYPDTKDGETGGWNIKALHVQKQIRYQDIDVHNYIWRQIEKELFAPVE